MSVAAQFTQNGKDSTLPIVNYYDAPLKSFLAKTKQENLKQSAIMMEAKDILVGLDIEEIYLRGSFSFGEADLHSDIDFFAVVDPDRLEEIHQSFTEALHEKYPIVANCFDNVVDGYGGAGFTYVCKDNQDGKPFIFDLYFGLRGVTPKKMLFECPRIYSKDMNYCWLYDDNAKDGIPEKAEAYIEKHQNHKSKAEALQALYEETLVVNATMMKHTERGQIIRMTNDNWHLVGGCIQMLQITMNKRSYRSPYFTGDKIIEDCLDSPFTEMQKIGQSLQDLIEAPVNKDKSRHFFNFSTSIMEKFAPERYAAMKPNIDNYSQLFSEKNGYKNINVLKL